MKLRSKFLLYSSLTHLTLIFLLFLLLEVNKYLFILGEILVLCSIGVSIWLYRSISEPFKLISSGIESIKDKDFTTRLIHVGHPEMDELIDVYNQMIDQLREERIKQSEKNYFLSKLIEASPSAIIMLDSENKIASMNPAAATLPGFEANFIGQKLDKLSGTLASELNNLQDGKSEILTINGTQIYKCQKAYFVDRGFSHYFIMIEELSDEIYKKEKSAFEKVIRMMSHETNNSIGAINSILSTILTYKSQLEEKYRDDYDNALTVAINRNKALSTVMSNFADVVKIPEPIRESIDVHSLLKTVQVLMDAQAKDKVINWEWQLESKSLIVEIDVQQIELVLINVIKNAIEAIQSTGTIILRTSSSPRSLSILDNGHGISREVSKQLFSAFFSTKKNGQGVGLTLTREVLYNHGMEFSLESRGGWTEFKISF
ncbi:sensor histidine kinase [Daejeonella lutea]|uniref:histidine kinase n=1 Tax=Daejeonella lutea TaxID=572036 RepID=A0A1T5BQL4_9SPHI|nr:ATP-binding protein [Daejeonella lutea]SKB49445.1 HAMP domain-containing protein [Daejeonella lutea]